jgi:hypothetical protein
MLRFMLSMLEKTGAYVDKEWECGFSYIRFLHPIGFIFCIVMYVFVLPIYCMFTEFSYFKDCIKKIPEDVRFW